MLNTFKELKIRSLKKNWALVERFAEEICEDYHISNRYFGNIMLALEEAVMNSITHGNGNDPNKFVTIQFVRKRSGLTFIVEDEGEGFDVNAIANPLESDTNTGNGIFVIRTLADRVKYNHKGNRVELLFTISSINQETTINRRSQMNSYFDSHKTPVK